MKLQLLDVLIIAAYLVIMLVIGLMLKKKASKNLDSYFLGGKTLPFYMLGLSNASGMFDISAFLGKEETLMRLRKAIEVLK